MLRLHGLAIVPLLLGFGCGSDQDRALKEGPGDREAPVAIHRTPRLGSVETGRRDPATGAELRVGCPTCHSMDVQKERKHDAAALEDFHRGLEVRHGPLACTACHSDERPDRLHLAAGDPIASAEVMVLCAQCHGPQYRDYRRGSHGGMTGYWDRSRGPRVRNHCVDCHDPHVPATEPVQPVLSPGERRPLEDHHP